MRGEQVADWGPLGHAWRVIQEHVRVRPAPGLRPLIAWYSGYREVGVAPAIHRGLPSPYLTLIFTLDEPLTIARHVDPSRAPGDYDALLGGLHTAPAIVTHDGRQSGIQLAVHPLAARTLLGLPAGELAGLDGDAAAVLGPVADQIRDRLQEASSWPRRFAVLDRMLLPLLRDAAPAAEVRHAWALLQGGDATTVSAIADEVGWSERHLRGRFGTELGLSPKAAARIVRFDRARRLLPAAPSIAQVATDCGYYDQPHLAREFRELAGCSPNRWLDEEFRNVQAGVWANAAGSAP